MKLGLSSFSVGWSVGIAGEEAGCRMGFIDLIELTAHYGLKLLQVGDNLPLHTLPDEELEYGRQLLERYGIELELGTRGLHEETINTYLELADYFRSKLIRIVIDQPGYEPSEAKIVSLLRKIAPRLEKQKVCLAIENHDRLKASTLAQILDQVASPWIGICLDTANSLGAGEGIEHVVDTLLPYTVNLHMKDFQISRVPHQMGFFVQGTAAGQGALNIPELIEKVRNNGRSANCILELWTPPCYSAAETCKKEKEYVDQSVKFLLPLIQRSSLNFTFGASAAYTISRFGADFKISDICRSIRELAEAGFRYYQPEISYTHALEEWENGGTEKVNACCAETGMKIRQLIAHFVMDYFRDDDIVQTEAGVPEMRRFIDIALKLKGCRQILIPVGPLTFRREKTTEYEKKIRAAFWDKLSKMLRLADEAGLGIAFELLPDNFIGNFQELFTEGENIGVPFGINFDTAHALVNGENVSWVPCNYRRRIIGTHLGDTAGKPGDKRIPGKGTLAWGEIMRGLCAYGNQESLDLEIFAPSDIALESYIEGRKILEGYLK